jgi:putative redox protein
MWQIYAQIRDVWTPDEKQSSSSMLRRNIPEPCIGKWFRETPPDRGSAHNVGPSTSRRAAPVAGPRTIMECTVHWMPAAGMAFTAETGSGHLLTMDGAPDGGGRNLAPRPMELLLAGAAGCTAYDVVLILKRGRHAVGACQVQVKAERATADPKVFTALHLHFIVSGKAVPAVAVERAIALSHEKYCSATIMLGRTAAVTTSFELIDM